jgi:DNA-directed RNA polymerase alpha subunit
MKNRKLEITRAQWLIKTFDLQSCKMLSHWLTGHIKLLEMDVSRFDKSIKEIGLSTRAYNVLRFNGIDSLKELIVISYDLDNIRILKGAGVKVVKEIREKVHEFKDTYASQATAK